MIIIPILKGILTYFPITTKFFIKSTGGTNSARYCYSVWLRNLIMSYENGLSTKPNIIAELGPGDSLGIGLAGLLSGSKKYYALDIVKYANIKRNVEIFDELLELFNKRENIPDENEFPKLKPYLKSYDFPSHILTKTRLNKSLNQNRLDCIRDDLLNLDNEVYESSCIEYFVPWYDSKYIKSNSVEMIFSQAVLEHIDDLKQTYIMLFKWLKNNGFMAHQIDFKCHKTSKMWNGHWTYSDFIWMLIKGKNEYLINRQPHSIHVDFMNKIGFSIICDIKIKDFSGIKRDSLAKRFKDLSDDDLITSGAFIQAVKK